FVEQLLDLGLEFNFLAFGHHVPSVGERTSPLVAEAHDELRENVLITVRLGEVIRDQIGAHRGSPSVCGGGRYATVTRDGASFRAPVNRGRTCHDSWRLSSTCSENVLV